MNEFVAHCAELLGPLGSVKTRRMFSGTGFYLDDVFMALIFEDRLYLKTDASSRAAFEAAGCAPFAYDGSGKTVTTSYFSAPDEAMESPLAMEPWARLAIAAALRARATKPLAAKAVKRAKPRKGGSKTAPSKL